MPLSPKQIQIFTHINQFANRLWAQFALAVAASTITIALGD
jgi:hypothetical protein